MGADATERVGEAEAVAGSGDGPLAAIVAARNEADRIADTLAALRDAFPDATLWVADDASTDGTAE
ncbi:MAG TPA: glycosyltransferase, partial [Solirubrobacterales bacterium]|nr:glycosyltransferase [Solirubrobacterales bacterium]